MEDIARLALIEQSLRDADNFSKILHELLYAIYQILENPHEYELRTLKSEVLKKVLHSEAFTDYLQYIGFRPNGDDYSYPKEETLGRLRVAQAAIERKIYFCCGSLQRAQRRKPSSHMLQGKRVKFTPSNILDTKNPLLLKMEALFNNMIRYESAELQELARGEVPLVTLQLMALDRVREQQRGIKAGEITGHDLSFDTALLMELMGWFKHKFFSWVDRPPCDLCAQATAFARTEEATTETETCTVEIYVCKSCGGETQFPRYNDPATLLRTRRGRCGEWANCFTLLCRALGYDTRYVYDTTDHVWCEVFDQESNQWLHVDPCEGQLDTPLMYCHGWGKSISYVIAVSRDDLQDVTWRYTMDHKEVLRRRNLCSEGGLIAAILELRQHRQRQATEARRRYLARRAALELVQMMVERKPNEFESHGRISGAKEWRTKRGEVGKHTFLLTEAGTYDILYYTASDKYEVLLDGKIIQQLDSWEAGVYDNENVFRKHETDWQMVYLAREEGAPVGTVSWRLEAAGGAGAGLTVAVEGQEFDGGRVECAVTFDGLPPEPVALGEKRTFSRRWAACEVRARLRGGGGAGWQRAQLARQPAAAVAPALRVRAVRL